LNLVFGLNEPVSGSIFSGRFQYCVRCGQAKPAARSDFEFQCEACGHRHFVNPIAAVVALLSNREGELLLIRRARDPGRGKLGLPGGFVDPGEAAEEALGREVREETGLTVAQWHYFGSLPNQYLYQGYYTPTLDLFYTGTTASFAEARALAEVEALVIVRPGEIAFQEIAFSSNEKALRCYASGQSLGHG